MKVYKCDHCGSEFTKVEYKNYFVTKTITHTVHVLKKTKDFTCETEYNLCNYCYDALREWLHDAE